MIPDCRIRRRGAVLREAVLDATRAEITEVGLQRLSMDKIAQRAGTGKAALYRRWSNIRALVLDVVVAELQTLEPPAQPSSGSLRTDLVRIYTAFADALEGPTGTVLVEFIAEGIRDPALISDLQAEMGKARRDEALRYIDDAIARDEIPAQRVDSYLLEVTPALIVSQLVTTGHPPAHANVERIVDTVVLPLLRQPASAGVEALQPAV